MSRFLGALGNRSSHGISSDTSHGSNTLGKSLHGGGEVKSLVRECTNFRQLRQLVRKMDEDTSVDTRKSVNEEDTVTNGVDPQIEIAALKRELKRLEDEKATMELDFMNQLTQIASSQNEKFETPEKQIIEESKSEITESSTVDTRSDRSHDSLNSIEVQELTSKIENLENEKSELSQQIKALQQEVESGAKVLSSFNEAMMENDKHFQSRIEKLESELTQKNCKLKEQYETYNEMAGKVTKIESQRTMFLEEITDLRMNLDKKDDDAKALKKELEELNQKLEEQKKVDAGRVESLQQALSNTQDENQEIKSKMETMTIEMQSITTTYKEDISRLEEATAILESEVEKSKKTIGNKDTEIQGLKDQLEGKDQALEALNRDLDDVRKENATLVDLREKLQGKEEARTFLNHELEGVRKDHALMESQLSNALRKTAIEESAMKKNELQGDHTNKKLIDMEQQVKTLEKLTMLERQVQTLERKLSFEKASHKKLKSQFFDSKKQRPPPIQTSERKVSLGSPESSPPTPVRVSPLPSFFRSRSESPSFRNSTLPKIPNLHSLSDLSSPGGVKALTACFEHSKNDFQRKEMVTPKSVVPLEAPTGVIEQTRTDPSELEKEIRDLKDKLSDATSQNEFLQQRLRKQCDQVAELNAKIASLNAALETINDSSRREAEQVRNEKKSKLEKVESELIETRNLLNEEKKQVEVLKQQINDIHSERLAYEESTMEAFERRAAKGQLSHQTELNALNVQLTTTQMKLSSLEKEHEKQIKELEEAMEVLNADCDKELEEKEGQVDMYKHQYEQQLDMVSKLEKERESLYEQIKTASNGRREEIADLQSDLMDKEAENTALKRSLQAIQMQVEHQTDHVQELEYLRERVTELESKLEPVGTAKHMQSFELEKLKEENIDLKDQVRLVTTERRKLQERLNVLLEEQEAMRGQPQVLRERNEKLRREVARLTKKLEKIQGGGVSRIAI